MSKIKFCALGGLGENGKNLYVVTVDEKIFILDAGIKYPSVELYGVDAVIAKMSYLVENKDKIVGVFLSHGHEENIGAIAELLKNVNVPVYCSYFTMAIVEMILQEENLNVNDYKLVKVNDDDILTFGDVTVSFFYVTHSVPQSMGISINTCDGSIVYVADFTISFIKDNHYQTSFDRLSEVSKNKVLMLCPESLGVNNYNRVNNDYTFNHIINEALSHSKRAIFSMFSYDLNRVQKVVDLCVANNRRIVIIGRKVQKTINVAMNTGYLKIPADKLVNLKFIDENNTNDDDDLAIIVTGVRHEPYFMLQRMITNQDKLIKITKSDTVIIISPPVLGTEKIATRAIDQLSQTGCKVINMDRSIIRSSHADSEDLKMLYQMFNPNYICPVIGEYRHQYVQKNIALEAGYKPNEVVVLDNGEEITFENGLLLPAHNKVSVGDVLVDGSIVGDINEIVLKDRESLSENGAVIIVANIDSNKHIIISGPKVVMKGFISTSSQVEVSESIIKIVIDILNSQFAVSNIDWNELKNIIRDNVAREVRNLTRKNPIIIPVIIDVSETNGDN